MGKIKKIQTKTVQTRVSIGVLVNSSRRFRYAKSIHSNKNYPYKEGKLMIFFFPLFYNDDDVIIMIVRYNE